MVIHHMTLICSTTAGTPRAARTGGGRFAARLRRLAVAGALAAMPLGALAAPPRYHVTVLPAVPGQPYVLGMNESSDIVAAFATAGLHSAVLYSAAGMTLLPTPPGSDSAYAADLNETGLIVGAANNWQALYWQGGVSDYLPGGGERDIMGANGVNAAGEIVGSWDYLAAYWPSAQSPVQFLPSISQSGTAMAYAINDAGQIAGGASNSGHVVAVRWAHAGAAPTVIGCLPDSSGCEALAINSAGDLAGRSFFPPGTSSARAMFYDEAAGQLVELGGEYSVAFGINDAQAVVGAFGESEYPAAGLRGFLWLDGTMYDLNDLVDSSTVQISAVTKAVAINNASQIAVEVILPSGELRAARLTPLGAVAVPAVSVPGLAATALVLAALGIQLLRRRLPGTG